MPLKKILLNSSGRTFIIKEGVINNHIKFLHFHLYRWRQQVDDQSSPVKVDSGFRQGSVLGHCLILYYINDLSDKLSPTVCLLADNVIIYLGEWASN